MPFENHGTVSINTYNDVAGNIITNVYSPGTSSSTQSRSLTKTILPFSFPTKEPYSSFINVIFDIQDALNGIESIINESTYFRPLNDELSSIVMTTASIGRLMEILEYTYLRRLVLHRRISDRVGRSIRPLEPLVDDIRRCRDGLKFTLIGPLWRRVLWSAMWHLSPDSDFMKVIDACHRELATFKQPLERLLVFHSNIIADPDYILNLDLADTLAKARYQDLKYLIRSQAPSWPSQHISQNIITCVNDLDCYERSIPIHAYLTYQDLLSVLFPCSHTVEDLVDPCDHQLVSPKKIAVIRSQPPSNYTLHPLFITSKLIAFEDRDDICPRCEHVAQGQHQWNHCQSCGLRFRATAFDLPASDTFDLPWLYGYNVRPFHSYVLVQRYNIWDRLSTISSIKHISGLPSHILWFLRHISRIDAALTSCRISVDTRYASLLIPSHLGLSIGPDSDYPIILQHLRHLYLQSWDESLSSLVEVLNELYAPRLLSIHTQYPLASHVLDFFLRHATLQHIRAEYIFNWDISVEDFVHRLLHGLPSLETLFIMDWARQPVTSSTLHSIADVVAQYINLGPHSSLRNLEMGFSHLLYGVPPLPHMWQMVHKDSASYTLLLDMDHLRSAI